MKKSEFEYDRKRREEAIIFFPNFFGEDLCVSETATPEDLQKEYQRLFISKDNNELNKFSFQDAYYYLRNAIKEEIPELTSPMGQKIYEQYKALINEISKYKFNVLSKRPQRKNIVNREILYELAFLRKYIIKQIEIIDQYFTQEDLKEIKNEKYQIIYNSSKELYNLLLNEVEKLKNKKVYYSAIALKMIHSGRNYTRRINLRCLGDAREEWRKERNSACHTIMTFYNLISLAGFVAYYELFGKNRDAYRKYCGYYGPEYDDDLEFIKKGPNYYNYLSRDQIFSAIEWGKVKRKERLKSRKKNNED